MKITEVILKDKNIDKLQFGDINIFVGPNGVGKTTIMNEIRDSFGRNALENNYWVSNVIDGGIEKDDAEIILKYVNSETELKDSGEVINKYHFKHYKTILGRYDLHSPANHVYNDDEYKKIVSLSKGRRKRSIHLVNQTCTNTLLVGYENTQDRLSLAGEHDIADFDLPITDSINNIFLNKEYQEVLNKVFISCFNRPLTFSNHRGKKIEILVGELNSDKIDNIPVGETSSTERGRLFKVDNVGDGIRAASKLLISLFNPESRVIFIDEPEAFIHPKQKMRIAKEIKKLAKENKKQLFLSTHDATFLAGLIDDKESDIDVGIFYIKNNKKIVPLDNFSVDDGRLKPGTKQQKYFQSLFYDGSIFVEGVDDRCFYENTFEYVFAKELSQADVVYTDLGTVSNAHKQITKFVRESEINAVFIFDNNVISTDPGKQQKLVDTYEDLGGEKKLRDILEKLDGSVAELGKLDKILKEVGIFISPYNDIEGFVMRVSKRDDDFPYKSIQSINEKPSRKFKTFGEDVINYLLHNKH
ncbi:hypothetical protein COT97_03680 [Candidatus Falkowbacteria bacterium CG10_big_fil_rev_8_21_14_0_10_39_11]|uniref:AAA+ ATPase domain-containing protein n=1 Tax=Candidatus Falkowbacteria bacterium CG10_big_fil_rev_8_21_14_0_10_39_11 TaxID=1974565 RepID=A0A2H0V4G0_9BACT|nr:MAG: hypothetical protein COT97_03680 [Candidatus Falkowbacteria bacterium CG10_big_fil_rev_8_21_14_0_10_39_11]